MSSSPLPFILQQEPSELALHMAVRLADRLSLPLVDFIIQNGCVPSCPWCPLSGPQSRRVHGRREPALICS